MSASFSRRRERFVPAERSTIQYGRMKKFMHPFPEVVSNLAVTGTSIPMSEQEVTWDRKNPGPPYRTGGSFANLKFSIDGNSLQGVGKYTTKAPTFGDFKYEYTGGFVRPIFGWELDLIPSYKRSATVDPFNSGFLTSVSPLGSMAFDSLKPKLEKAGLSVFLGEIREVPKMFQKLAAGFRSSWISAGGKLKGDRIAGKVADDFLSANFGWVPFISDLIKFDKVYQDSKRYIDRIADRNNKWSKRFKILSTESSSTIVQQGSHPGVAPWGIDFERMCDLEDVGGNASYGRFVQRRDDITTTWAKGSFKYYRPEFDRSLSDFDSQWSRLQRYLTLYGFRVNPSVLWNLCPWTWLIDYFANIGDLIQRITEWGQDAVVSKYLYLMQTKHSTLTHTSTVNFHTGKRTFVWKNLVISKLREEAESPFAFTLSGDLTARQLAIMAALGLKRR